MLFKIVFLINEQKNPKLNYIITLTDLKHSEFKNHHILKS